VLANGPHVCYLWIQHALLGNPPRCDACHCTRAAAQSPAQLQGCVTCLAFDAAGERYLLGADTRGGVLLFDADAVGPSPPTAPVASSRGAHHRGAVMAAGWYPADAGMFLSGGVDGRVHAWDTRRFAPASTFTALAAVNCVAMSPCAGHALVAGTYVHAG
jgi:hypothetical protein